MEFLQSRHAKLFLIVVIILGAMVLGVMKQLESDTVGSKKAPAKTTENAKQEETTSEDQAKQTQEEEIKKEVAKMMQEGGENATGENGQSTQASQAAFVNTGYNIQGAINELAKAAESSDLKTKKRALSNMAECYLQLNDSPKIIETYNKLLEIEDDKAAKQNIYERMAETYNYSGDYGNALASYQESYKIEPTLNNTLKICALLDKLHDANGITTQLEDYLTKNPQDRAMFGEYREYIMRSEVLNRRTHAQGNAPKPQTPPQPATP